MKKRKSFDLFSLIERYWKLGGLLIAISGSIWAFASLPGRVAAVEQKQTKVEQYIAAIEEQKKLIQQSPPGWRWSEEAQQYVQWPDDPRLRKK